MKLDLLKKLTALANNNPNENEANLAARKVCLMLAEAKFVLPIEQPKVSIRPQAPWPYGPRQEPDRPKPKEEPEFKSYYYEPDPGFNPFRDIFERMYNSPRPKPKQEPKPEPSQTKENPFTAYPFDDVFNFDLDDLIGKQVNVKIPRQDPRGFKQSDFRNYNPADDTLEFSCIRCKGWNRISKIQFEELRGCVVCSNCGGKANV